MKNKQKFHRSQLVRLKGQPDSPAMTITKILRTIEESEPLEKAITFAYECSWWDIKRDRFNRLELEENTLEKVK